MADKVEDFTNYLFDQRRMSAVGQAMDAYHGEENKDQAAHSIKLGQVFNQNPEPIYHDYDHFVADKKATLASDLLNKNRYLQDYVNYHPLAAVVSQDDWMRLDKLTELLSQPNPYLRPGQTWDWVKHLPSDIIDSFLDSLKGFRDIAKDRLQGKTTLEEYKEPVAPSLAQGYSPETLAKIQERLKYTSKPLITPIVMAYMQARYAHIIGAMNTFWIRPVSETTGIPRETVEQATFLAMSVFGVKHLGKEASRAATDLRILELYKQAKAEAETVSHFAKAGEDPPKGVNRDVDKVIADVSKAELDQAKEEQKAVEATDTKAAAPELVEKLIDDIRQGQEVEVKWDAVKRMYGDKSPEPGDKMLGDVPDIQKQWADSMTNGKPIVMTKAHWMSKVDPETWKKLEDDYRDRPELMTKNEIKSLQELEELADRIKAEQEAKEGKPEEPKPKTLLEDIRTQAGLDMLFERGAVMSKTMQDRFSRWKKKFDEANATKELRDKMREAKLKLTPEWKSNRIKMREEVEADIDQHPVFKMNEALQYGTHNGKDIGKVRIDPDTVYPYQRSAIPDRLFSKTEGFTSEQLGKLFGYQNGFKAMDALTGFYKEKGNLGAKAYREKVIEKETDRRMELRYGKLDELILQEAREHIIGQRSNFDWLHEETVRLATILKQQGPMDKADIRAQAAEKFRTSQANKADLRRIIKYLGEAGKDAELAYHKNDLREAFRLRQEQTHLLAEAQFIDSFQRQVWKPLNRMIKTYNAAEVTGVPQKYLNYIHEILAKVGKPSVRTPENIREAMELQPGGFKTWEEFANEHNTGENNGLPIGFEQFGIDYTPHIVITDFLLNPKWHGNFDKMTVGEARAVHASLASLIEAGRGVNTITLRGKKKNFEEFKNEGIVELSKMGEKARRDPDKKIDQLRNLIQSTNIGLQQIEHWFAKLDFWDPRGFFSTNFFYPMIEAANSLDASKKIYATKLAGLAKYAEVLKKPVNNDIFMDQRNRDILQGEPSKVPLKMTREHLRGVLLNIGNKSNLEALAKGYNLKEQDIIDWAHREALKEDWQWAADVGKIFSEIQRSSDLMTMRMNGSVIDKIPLGTVDAGVHGKFDGWYFPLRYDRTQGGVQEKSVIDKTEYIRIMTDHGWEYKRTGYIGPVDLSLKDLGQQIERRLRDIHLREPLFELQKFFRHKDVQTAISLYQGEQYMKVPLNWLRDIAGQHGYQAGSVQAWSNIADFVRTNLISTLVGWNPGTLVKHNFSAYAQSMREVGVKNFLRALGDFYQTDKDTMMKNYQFAMENSLELQRRQQHWQETLGGSLDLQLGKSTLRARSMYINSIPMAYTDGFGSKITWLAKYRSTMEENVKKGMSHEESHADAVTLADRAVRNSHGSTSIASRPEFMRMQGPMMQSIVALYGFYNHVYQRYNKIYEQAKLLPQEGAPRGQYIGSAGLDLISYAAIPIFIHAVLDGHDKDSWWKRMGEGTVNVVGGTVPVARDVLHGLVRAGWGAAHGRIELGHFGIFSAAGNILANVLQDINPSHWDKHHFGSMIEHAITMYAAARGVGNQQYGRLLKYAFNLIAGEDKRPEMQPSFPYIQQYWRAGRWGGTRSEEENKKFRASWRRRQGQGQIPLSGVY